MDRLQIVEYNRFGETSALKNILLLDDLHKSGSNFFHMLNQ